MPPNPFDDRPSRARTKVAMTYVLLLAGNLAAWTWALIAFADRPALLGIAFLAYLFGLRHAFDADHIAAIDNVVRKLMQQDKAPYAVGFFFSLGHSSIVVLASVAIAMTATALQGRLGAPHDFGGAIGTVVSALFLLIIGLANLFILRGVWAAFIGARRGEPLSGRGVRRPAGGWRPADPDVPADLSCRIALVAHVSDRFAVRPRVRHRDGNRPARHIGDPGRTRHVVLDDPGVSRAVHRRHVVAGYHRQRGDGARLWLGVRQSDPQALVQSDHHRDVRCRRDLRRRGRDAGSDRRQARPRRRVLEPCRRSERRALAPSATRSSASSSRAGSPRR